MDALGRGFLTGVITITVMLLCPLVILAVVGWIALLFVFLRLGRP